MAEKKEKRYVSDNAQLMKEWNFEKNSELGLDPQKLTCGSGRKVWWKCSKGHEFETPISRRNNGHKCPICNNQKVLIGYNDLSTTNPQLALEWHPTKNSPLTANMVTYGSTKNVWWMCENGHEWKATVNNRSTGYGCPYCFGRKPIKGETDLETLRPDLTLEWHSEKNKPMLPSEMSIGSKKIVWWKCKNGHEWKAAVYSRNEGNGCPICAKRSHSSFPEQAIYYFVKKYFPDAQNGFKIPKTRMELDIYIPSLSVGIEYDGAAWHNNAVIFSREQKKYDLCASKNITLIRVKEEFEKTTFCDALFTLPKCPTSIELDKTIKSLLEYLGIKAIVNTYEHTNYIKAQYLNEQDKHSLANVSPHLLSEWHPTLNKPLTPQMVSANAHDKAWWLCSQGHVWQARIYSRVHGNNCPFCSNQKILVGYNDLFTTHPNLSSEWHPNKNFPLTPKDVSHGSKKEVFWLCSKGHEWKASISTRTKGVGCPYCANKKVLPGYNDLKTLRPDIAQEWNSSKNGTITAEMVTVSSGKKVWWKCNSCGNEWQAVIAKITNGSGCPECAKEKRKKSRHKNLIPTNLR